VNPTIDSVAGLRAYPTLADVPGSVDLVDVFRPAAEAAGVAHQAVAGGARTVLLHQSNPYQTSRALSAGAGVAKVEDACAGAIAARLDLRPRGSES
jgi:predicted CoA-binding protein